MKRLWLFFSIFVIVVTFGCKLKNIRAIVVYIDSPGGSVVPCQEIYQTINELRKPTVACLGILAASGGYYIACACDKIVSNQGTMTGSIEKIKSG